jgi:predicted GNAT family acetyltransferase
MTNIKSNSEKDTQTVHLLDNPMWNALISGNKNLSHGHGGIRYFSEDVASFVGMEAANSNNFKLLDEIMPAGRTVITATATDIEIPEQWKVLQKMLVLQMIYTSEETLEPITHQHIPLEEKDIPAMLELTALTAPGPFYKRTIEFGNYHGIFDDRHQLIAMAGQRLSIGNYREISAVCTHPDHSGKGYASALILYLVQLIQAQSCIPMLHVKTENLNAVRVYEKLGFSVRQELNFNAFQK